MIFLACLLTVAVETVFLAAFGYNEYMRAKCYQAFRRAALRLKQNSTAVLPYIHCNDYHANDSQESFAAKHCVWQQKQSDHRLFLLFDNHYRDRYALTVIVCANVVTNLLLNLLLWLLGGPVGAWIYPLEALVVISEYAVYSAAFRPGWKLFLLTLAANCISYGLGLLIFR